ncbi:ABC transporter ATP-binding protein [Gloeobacter kilaueensis]|uniref:ABC transporter n=1 Tax=Gloeobacter kilaueensis (strain ATCC BAA-2537 / CCAP 1431/1 / ULC 316 / JS1) TaxID=1183438 RepID=U5QIS0_GLOK1|nr:ATP-binding cassette domain-containing protein [Gloeobacter kilaueensis]AGY58788.1 ABC transporter [Gloeobacter kilaueensis JS1]
MGVELYKVVLSVLPNGLRLQNLSLTLQSQIVLANVSLTLAAGTIGCLIGANGSGKSSLLRCLNRLYETAPGSVFLGEQDITALPVLSLRRRVSLVAQQPALFAGTVHENLAYGPRLHGEPFSVTDAKELLLQVQLEPAFYLDRDVQSLSGGEAQRVNLARSLANRPWVLLLDEPTAALDPLSTRHVEDVLLQLNREERITVLWVSHDPAQVLRVAHALFQLERGRLVAQGDPGAVLGAVPEEGSR